MSALTTFATHLIALVRGVHRCGCLSYLRLPNPAHGRAVGHQRTSTRAHTPVGGTGCARCRCLSFSKQPVDTRGAKPTSAALNGCSQSWRKANVSASAGFVVLTAHLQDVSKRLCGPPPVSSPPEASRVAQVPVDSSPRTTWDSA